MKHHDYFVVDCHLHGIFRSPAEGWKARATEIGFDNFGGTVDEIIRYMDELGIAQCWCLPAFPSYGLKLRAESRLAADLTDNQRVQAAEEIKEDVKGKLERFNESNCAQANAFPDRLAPLVSLDAWFGSDWMVGEIEKRVSQGARGVKLLPDWCRFFPNDRVMWPAYAKIQELGIVLLCHSGWTGGTLADRADTETKGYTWPLNYADILVDFPDIKLVLAHLGERNWKAPGWGLPEAHLEIARRFPNVWFDISGAQEIEVNVPFLREVGVERILWGSDWSAHRHSMALLSMIRSAFTEDEKRKILGENARKLIDL